MLKPKFRNPDIFQVLPFREWIRENLPSGLDGFVTEDLDLVVRVYGPNYQTDGIGKFMLIELKFGKTYLGYAQIKTFRLIHDLLRKSDPEGERYYGYYVIQYDNQDWDKANFIINQTPVTREQLVKFLQFDFKIDGYFR